MKFVRYKLPERIEILEHTPFYGKFLFTPLEKGMGWAIGNALRRVLLSSIPGAAITALRIDGVWHEFSSLENIREDVPEIILNLKKVKLKLTEVFETTLRLEVQKKGEVKAKDLKGDHHVEIVNPDQYLFTVVEDLERPLRMEMEVTTGRGYTPLEYLRRKNAPVGTIFIDGLYSPVTRVTFEVGTTRVEERVDYDELTMEIWTDGRVDPKSALVAASKLLILHMERISELEAVPVELVKGLTKEEEEFLRKIQQPIDTLKDIISSRTLKALKDAGIETVSDLIQYSEEEIYQIPNIGRKSIDQLKAALGMLNLALGMQLEEKFKKYIIEK